MWQPQFISALSAILAVLGVACATPKKPVTVEPFHLTVCGIPQPKTVGLPRFSGQVDYAASAFMRSAASYSIGLTPPRPV